MNNFDENVMPAGLHEELAVLVKKKKWNIKAAQPIACLDVDAEQLWVLRFYKENGILPTIKQAKAIKETCNGKKLTLKMFRTIMESSIKPKWIQISYDELVPFFDENMTTEDIKKDILKVLKYWENNRTAPY